jgi:hypothetical protein
MDDHEFGNTIKSAVDPHDHFSNFSVTVRQRQNELSKQRSNTETISDRC